MILIDSLYINNSGGKILLDYLVEELEKQKAEVIYLFDIRVENDYQEICSQRKYYLKATLYNRYRFYQSNKDKFKKVLCFGNIPPMMSLKNICVYTYIHQSLYLNSLSDLQNSNTGRIKIFKLSIKKIILNLFSNNTDYWVVQLDSFKRKFSDFYKINEDNILVIPFYPPLLCQKNPNGSSPNSYIYVSSGAPHKNQILLIHAFCDFYDQTGIGKLTLTISDQFKEVYKLIEEKKRLGYPIRNLGFIDREELCEEYRNHEYLVFPSLNESFGLGIIEAIENNCKVIGADLPYLNDVCKPSISFNPHSRQSLVEALLKSTKTDVKATIPLIHNDIDRLIELITI